MWHSDIRITAQVYAHLAPRDLADAVSVLDALTEGAGFHVQVSRGP